MFKPDVLVSCFSSCHTDDFADEEEVQSFGYKRFGEWILRFSRSSDHKPFITSTEISLWGEAAECVASTAFQPLYVYLELLQTVMGNDSNWTPNTQTHTHKQKAEFHLLMSWVLAWSPVAQDGFGCNMNAADSLWGPTHRRPDGQRQSAQILSALLLRVPLKWS